jgi:hypothetical protein
MQNLHFSNSLVKRTFTGVGVVLIIRALQGSVQPKQMWVKMGISRIILPCIIWNRQLFIVNFVGPWFLKVLSSKMDPAEIRLIR